MTEKYEIKLEIKVSEKHLDEIIDGFYKHFLIFKDKKPYYIFDFSEVEYISNQELLVLTALIKYLINSKIHLNVYFLKRGPNSGISYRKAKIIVQIWEIWGIGKVVPGNNYGDYFDVTSSFVSRLKREKNIYFREKEKDIYERYGVTPFLCLDRLVSYNDRAIQDMLGNVYKLSKATYEILMEYDCIIPFKNQTLSDIITKELYENFLDHFSNSLFSSLEHQCFMSLSLKRKFDEKQRSESQNQSLLTKNFHEENLPKFKSFYYDKKSNKFKNQSFVELSFLDFGQGITSLLESNYSEATHIDWGWAHFERHQDTRILEYAFRHDSSRFQNHLRYLRKDDIPRGLFDVISIVKRFEGLLVARSNYGKVLFDFSDRKGFKEAVKYFGNEKLYFPGTLISIYLPERTLQKEFDKTVIKPVEKPTLINFPKEKIKYLSLFDIQERVKEYKFKDDQYQALFKIVVEEISQEKANTLIYFDFKGFDLDERIGKKIIFFLASDYDVNTKNNVIIINPPPKEFLSIINSEVMGLTQIDKQYKLHPTPFIYIGKNQESLEIYWLGIYSEEDINQLNKLLLDTHDLRMSDFDEPENVVGHINFYDEFGNFKSIINGKNIAEYYKSLTVESNKYEIAQLISSCIQEPKDSLYLCPGNYYQHKFVLLGNVLTNGEKCDFLVSALYEKLIQKIADFTTHKFLCITTNSEKILNSLIKVSGIDNQNALALDNLQELEKTDKLTIGDKVILICDVISTGYQTNAIENILMQKGVTLNYVGVLVNTIDENSDLFSFDYDILFKRVVYLYRYKIERFSKAQIKDKLNNNHYSVIRVNPFTITPIFLSIKETNYQASILLTNKEFLDLIPESIIKIGYFKYNNLIHPYFFNMDELIKIDKNAYSNILKKIFSRINENVKEGLSIICYPSKSSIGKLKNEISAILKNQNLHFIELERYLIIEGWVFTQLPPSLDELIENKEVMILDDGSCSGESLIQMIESVSSLDPKKITVLTIVGRVEDHKREFFSSLANIKGKNGLVDINVFFGTHWNIPTYYIEESPVIRERMWIEDLKSFPNTPKNVRDIADKILPELQLKKVESTNNKFLIKSRKNTKISILKELALCKNEIGKVTNYRFFKEHFYYFDKISFKKENIGKYEYKDIEIICGVFCHEPYLYQKAKNIVPDIVEKVESLIKGLFFTNTTINLYYNWNKKNLIHLLFIAFKEDRLFEILTVNNFTNLLEKYLGSPSNIDYILFKISTYLPFTKEKQEESKFSGDLLHLIDAVLEKKNLAEDLNRRLKRYRSFVATLPYEKADFKTSLATVRENYGLLLNSKDHSESLSAQLDVMRTQIDDLIVQYDKEAEKNIIAAWEKFDLFLKDLLSFSQHFPEYFAPLGLQSHADIVSGQEDSLMTKQGEITDLLFLSTSSKDFKRIGVLIQSIYSKFIESNSIYFKLFINTTTPDLGDEFDNFITGLKKLNFKKIEVEYSGLRIHGKTIDLPLIIVQETIFKELLKNCEENADESKEIKFEWKQESRFIKLTMINYKAKQGRIRFGNGTGIPKLLSLKEFPGNVAHYSCEEKENGQFIQILSFKTI